MTRSLSWKPHTAEIYREIERARQNRYATSCTHFLILQFETERELTPRKVVHDLVPQEKLYAKRKNYFTKLPKRRLNQSVLAVVIKLKLRYINYRQDISTERITSGTLATYFKYFVLTSKK
jgi:hypothetical protein